MPLRGVAALSDWTEAVDRSDVTGTGLRGRRNMETKIDRAVKC